MGYLVDGFDKPLGGLEGIVGSLHHINKNICERNGEVLTYERCIVSVTFCYSVFISGFVPILLSGSPLVVLS